MELPFRPILLTSNKDGTPSFNPCFNGIAFSTFSKNYTYHIIIYVSILVLMELPFRREQTPLVVRFLVVSILVLMELPFRLFLNSPIFKSPIFCFNPCFNGIAFSTKKIWGARGNVSLFQSLF